MGPDDPVDLDPDVLRDPLEGTQEVQSAPVPAERGLVPVDPYRRYMAELRKYPPLTREEEQELARRYRETGDRDALFRLVTSNLMLVVRVALSFRRAAKNLLDLIQEGNLGLLAAIDRFDPEVGVRLPTYAAWWVRAYIVKFLLDNVRLVRVGTTNARRKLLRNLRQEKSRLEAAGFEVGPKMLAEHFGVSEEDVKDVEAALGSRDVWIDAPLAGAEDRTQGDVLPASGPTVEEEVARRELQDKVKTAIARFRVDLGERERAILDDRLLSDDPATLQAIGDRFGTTREAVRQAEARLMTRLKEFLRAEIGDLATIRVGPD
ncbi:MAG TPA: sigma-70 family RNA polymerase sigma factor [Candidatus Polarisedimenticolaceae bacterium]|nr:sigma-70 family RNA polymerase sigma factor [Candidatus Polarisedimenticolaceae bacterium]